MKKLNWKEIRKEAAWMMKYAKRYWGAIVLYCVIGIVGTLMGLAGSIMSKYLIDTVTGYDTKAIGWVVTLMLSMGAGNILMNAAANRATVLISTKVYNEIQAEIYDRVMEADWESLYEYRSGDLLNRLTGDVKAVADSVIGWFPDILTKGVQFLGALIIILYYDPTMAVIALLSAPVSIVMSEFLLSRMRKYSVDLRKISSEVVTYQETSFQNIQTIKSFGIVSFFEEGMRTVQNKYKNLTMNYNKVSITATSILSFTGMLVSYACLGWGVYRLWKGAIIFGTLTLFIQLSSSLATSFSALISLVPQAISATTSAGRIMSVSEIKPERIESAEVAEQIKYNSSEGLQVNMKKVNFSYKDGEKVLSDIDLCVNPGSIVAFVGPSGEGKTTLMRILLGLINVEKGAATVRDSFGNECVLSAATRDLFSYVPQGNTIFADSIAANLRMVKNDATDEEIIYALETACAYEFVKNLPDGIYTIIGENGQGLSEGQAQRISIARAVLKNAPIILLDEATSALDVETEERVLRNIIKKDNKKICIVTTHRPSVLEICESVYKIDKTFLRQIKK
ncbi:ABC transporter ATP-binding protein [uncultured Eubacterium sp.]|uniref:ABC transporter ATP-binding protein n=1 Tax=uncultured Eubacterium sp. TaxID=165185 RepID=UPI0026710315|nr:ABC transporter ATP-binding protein [uncultured Eubacterium sp.]